MTDSFIFNFDHSFFAFNATIIIASDFIKIVIYKLSKM